MRAVISPDFWHPINAIVESKALSELGDMGSVILQSSDPRSRVKTNSFSGTIQPTLSFK
jgi:hypothetical protein